MGYNYTQVKWVSLKTINLESEWQLGPVILSQKQAVLYRVRIPFTGHVIISDLRMRWSRPRNSTVNHHSGVMCVPHYLSNI